MFVVIIIPILALTKKGNALREFRDEVEKIKKKGTKEKIRKLVMSL